MEVLPEEIIVHRDIGNLVSNDDLSTLSSIEYALKISKVKHIVICGHYGCQFTKLDSNDHHVESRWLQNVSQLLESHKDELHRINGLEKRNRHFGELHAWTQAQELMRKKNVSEAMEKRNLKVHAFMFDPHKETCVELTSSQHSGPSSSR